LSAVLALETWRRSHLAISFSVSRCARKSEH